MRLDPEFATYPQAAPAADMQKLFIVLYRATYDKSWHTDGVYENCEIAQARLRLEELEHPNWAHVLVVAEVPPHWRSANADNLL